MVLANSGLERDKLGVLWEIADVNGDGRLSRGEFAVAMHLAACATTKKLPIPRALPDCLARMAATTVMPRVRSDGDQHSKVSLLSEMKSSSDPIKIPKLMSSADGKNYTSELEIELEPKRSGEKPRKAGVATGSRSPEAVIIKKSAEKSWKPSRRGKSADSRALTRRDGEMIVRDTDSVAGATEFGKERAMAAPQKMLSPEEVDQQYAMSATERGRYEIIFMRVGFRFRRGHCGDLAFL